MSRQIIFRGKTLFENKLVCGYLTSLCEIRVFITDEWEGQYDAFNVDPGTVGQYTGWNDSKINTEYPKGQQIYEGDIIRDKNGTISYVVWEDGGFAVKSPGSEAVDWEHGGWYSNTEVIGNIHQNPELLNNK